MYTLINGSPKPQISNSLHFLKMISPLIDNAQLFDLRKNKYKEILDSVQKSEVIILAFPLYVDSPTSLMLEFLDYIIDNNINFKDKLVYVIINCGFRDGKQNITATNIIKRWCEKVGAIYGCSIQIGAGEIVGKNKFKFVSRKALKKIKEFSNIIKEKRQSTDIITTMDFINDKLYCYLANISWQKSGKKHSLSDNDLRIK